MNFKIGHNITRRNINTLTKEYKNKVILYSILVAVLVIIMSIGSLVNWFLRLYPNIDYIADNSLEFHLINVGEANASAIVFPNNDVLIFDTGLEDYSIEVTTYIDNVLLRRGGSVKYLIISHTDLDHTGNVDKIWDKYHPQKLYLPNVSNYANDKYQYLVDNATQSNATIIYNYQDVTLEVGDVVLSWLSPNRDYYESANDYSPIIMVEYNNYSMLITGDAGHNIGKDEGVNVEAEALQYAINAGIDMDVDVLVAGHHGSKYSTGALLLDYAKPENLLIPVGENSYGHPANELYDRVLEYDNTYDKNLLDNIYTTEQSGNIIVNTIGSGEYKISFINNINAYLFVPYVVIILLAIIPAIYLLIRSICIYHYLINYYTSKPTPPKEIEIK